jgi:putative transposase
VRYGYRRVHVLLRREGWAINHKRTRRLYREEGLQLRNKNPKRKVAAKLREDRVMATTPNECWAMDFMVDQLFDGRKLRVLTIVDICTKLCPAIGVAHAYKGHDVVAALEAAAREHGRPNVDNGPEFVSRDLDLWAWQHGVGSTTRCRASRPTTLSPKASTAVCGRNA